MTAKHDCFDLKIDAITHSGFERRSLAAQPADRRPGASTGIRLGKHEKNNLFVRPQIHRQPIRPLPGHVRRSAFQHRQQRTAVAGCLFIAHCSQIDDTGTLLPVNEW